MNAHLLGDTWWPSPRAIRYGWVGCVGLAAGLLAGIAAAPGERAGVAAATGAAPAETTVAALGPPRRIVTGHDAAGRSVILSDRAPPHGERFADLRFIELWRTTATPALITAAEKEEPTTASATLAQTGGSVLRFVDYQPSGHGGRRTPMHRTRTVDYAIVVSGEIVLLLDDSEVTLRAGDVVVQRGTRHAWENRSDKPARVAFVLIDGQFDTALRDKLPDMALTP